MTEKHTRKPASKSSPPVVSFRARDRATWRGWLEAHHATATSVLLVCARKDSGEVSITWDESVDEALCFGWVDGVRGTLDATHFTVRFTPRKPTSIWSKLNLARVERLTSAGVMRPEGLAAFALGKERGQHAVAYAIRDEVAMPPPLTRALAENAAGRKAFEALTPGQQKGWMRSVAWAKQEATQAQRARDALLLILAGRQSGETDNMAARRGIPSRAEILAGRAASARGGKGRP